MFEWLKGGMEGTDKKTSKLKYCSICDHVWTFNPSIGSIVCDKCKSNVFSKDIE